MPFEPGKAQPPRFLQAQAFWYQWLLCTKPGEKKFREDPAAFGKAQWDAWSPPGWYTNEELAAAKRSWTGKDFEDVVLHSYRSRWGHAELDPHYSKEQAHFESTRTLSTPTLLIHGKKDHCELLQTTEGAERHFKSDYQRSLIAGVGHFPQRENPEETGEGILRHLRKHAGPPGA